MARKLKSPTRTISNAGQLPRFIGVYYNMKAQADYLVFDSLTSLFVATYLEWRKDVVELVFEKQVYEFPEADDLPALRCIPDYEATLTSAELLNVEAKYSEEELSDEQRLWLDIERRQFERRGLKFAIYFRMNLEENGFIETIQLLRPYAALEFAEAAKRTALERLSGCRESDLSGWRHNARKCRVSTPLLYHLLYHQDLPLKYVPLQCFELTPWQD